MRVRIARALAIAGLILILVYGIDVTFSIYLQKSFLPLDAKIRGITLGIPGAVLSIMAFFLLRKSKSRLVGLLIFITGILMMSVSFVAAQFIDQSVSDLESFTKNMTTFIPVVGLGMYIIVLGLGKLRD